MVKILIGCVGVSDSSLFFRVAALSLQLKQAKPPRGMRCFSRDPYVLRVDTNPGNRKKLVRCINGIVLNAMALRGTEMGLMRRIW